MTTMSVEFLGFDHCDCRVRSLETVESFYDDLMPVIGLTEKRCAYIDPEGEWHQDFDTYNVVEYYESEHPTKPRRFFGLIESPLHRNNDTRIAFRVTDDQLALLYTVLERLGAQNIEESDDPAYRAIFFEDPAGTKLEFIGR
jgi:catechol 2,3-dioxygenase-like lactoylglutathione lyase family enzyme